MRNFTVGGRSVGISERELDCFTGVSRGGVLVVEVGAGPFDAKITSWSAIGFDCSPNREDLVSLLRKQLLSLIPINGRIQVGLTSDGKSIAQSMGVYSLATIVRDYTPAPDRTAEPVVAEEPVYTASDFVSPPGAAWGPPGRRRPCP